MFVLAAVVRAGTTDQRDLAAAIALTLIAIGMTVRVLARPVRLPEQIRVSDIPIEARVVPMRDDERQAWQLAYGAIATLDARPVSVVSSPHSTRGASAHSRSRP